jgi:ribosomal protein S12 methylthiotransferase accessory factor
MIATRDSVIDNETGIVRWVSEIPVQPGEPEVFNFSAKMCDSGRIFPVACFDNNGAAGLTREWAYRAAIGEAIERYCSSIYFPEELAFGSRAELTHAGRLLGPSELALFHESQRDSIRYASFTDHVRLCWTPAWSLTRRESLLVPASLVYVPYFPFRQAQGEKTIAPGISTGQACAGSFEAAVLSGIFEVVERDAFAISWANRLPLPQLEFDSSPRIRELFNLHFRRHGIEYGLYVMATDIAIPAVLCLIVDWNYDPPLICCGGAANLDPEAAAIKALVEGAQTREWAKFMGRRKDAFVIAHDFSNIDDFEKHVFLYGHGGMLDAIEFLRQSDRRLRFSDLPKQSTDNVKKDVRCARQIVESAGYEVMLVDLTTPDVQDCGYSVVKVLIPMLQPLEGDHTHRFFGGPRLYEVPGRVGYEVKSTFDTLNPAPHPYP